MLIRPMIPLHTHAKVQDMSSFHAPIHASININVSFHVCISGEFALFLHQAQSAEHYLIRAS